MPLRRSLFHFLQRQTRRAGMELSRLPGMGTTAYALQFCKIDTVLDVGANIGQTGEILRSLGCKGRIISFEPLSSAFAILSQKAQRDPHWECHPFALGKEETTSEIRVAAASDYSSFLKTSDYIEKLDPASRVAKVEQVRIRRLDDVWPELKLDNARIMMKIDTQGFERPVLEGAIASLPKISSLQLEMSVHPIYEGQPPFADMLQFVRSWDFWCQDSSAAGITLIPVSLWKWTAFLSGPEKMPVNSVTIAARSWANLLLVERKSKSGNE